MDKEEQGTFFSFSFRLSSSQENRLDQLQHFENMRKLGSCSMRVDDADGSGHQVRSIARKRIAQPRRLRSSDRKTVGDHGLHVAKVSKSYKTKGKETNKKEKENPKPSTPANLPKPERPLPPNGSELTSALMPHSLMETMPEPMARDTRSALA